MFQSLNYSSRLCQRSCRESLTNYWTRCGDFGVLAWNAHLLPTRYDYACTPLRKSETSLFFHSWCILAPIYYRNPMDSSAHLLLGRICDVPCSARKDGKNTGPHFCNGIHHCRTLTPSIHQLSWMGYGFYWASNGAYNETVFACLQSL